MTDLERANYKAQAAHQGVDYSLAMSALVAFSDVVKADRDLLRRAVDAMCLDASDVVCKRCEYNHTCENRDLITEINNRIGTPQSEEEKIDG